VTTELTCAVGKEVTIDIYFSAASHAEHPLTPDCTIHIPPQKGLTGATLTDETNGHFTLGGAAKGNTMTRTIDLLCGSAPPRK
jgi:predicted aspartyl protease